MATVFTLGTAAATVNLADTTKYAVLAEGIEPRPTRNRTLVPVSGRDQVRLVYSQAETLELPILLGVTGSTHDAFITNWRAIVEQLRLAREYARDGVGTPVLFTYQWATATASTVFEILDGDFPPPPRLTNPVVATGQFYDAQLTLFCQPYGRAETATAPSDQTLTNDTTGWTPTAVGGDAPTPARLRARNRTAGATMTLVRAATRSRGTPANFLFPLLAGHSSPTGYTLTPGTGGGPVSIRLSFRARVAAGTGTFWLIWRSGAGVNYRVGGMFSTASTSYVTHTRTEVINPATGSAFTLAELNAGQWGFEQEGTVATRITQFYGTLLYTDRDLVEQTENRLPNANGAATAWTVTGVANTYDALNDPVGTPDDDTTYLSSVTDAQIALVALDDFTTAIASTTTGVRSSGRDLLTNGGLEGALVANAPAGWVATGSGSIVTGVFGQAYRTAAATHNITQRISALASTVYRVRGYCRSFTGGGASQALITATSDVGTTTFGGTTATVFTAISFTFTTGVGATYLQLQLSDGNGQSEFDELSVELESQVGVSVEVVRVALTTNLADQYGAFRVMVRAKAAAAGELQLRWGGPTGALIANEAVALASSATIQIVDLGRMNIPEQEPPLDVTLASFAFSIWRGATGGIIDIDTIELWPAENYIELEPTTGPAQNEYAVIDALGRSPVAFLADTSGNRVNTIPHVGSPPVLRVGTSRVLLRMSRSRTDDRRGDLIGADLTFYQRYDVQRGAG